MDRTYFFLETENLIWIIVIANMLMYVLTILISYSWSKWYNHQQLPLTKKDIINSMIVLLVNISVAVPGYLLVLNGYIDFNQKEHFWRDVFLLLVLFDFVMYVLHFMAHRVWPFVIFHKKHHEHSYFNVISLYVMEPIEAILFGALLTIAVYLFTFNLFSFTFFLFINWILGVIGHLNTNSTEQPKVFGNHVYHKAHHQYSDCNFGFYTVIWDRAFGTYYKK